MVWFIWSKIKYLSQMVIFQIYLTTDQKFGSVGYDLFTRKGGLQSYSLHHLHHHCRCRWHCRHHHHHQHHLCWSTRWGGSILGRLVCTCREEPKGDLRDDDDGLWLWWYRWRFWLIFWPLQNFENLKMETFLWLYRFIVCYFCVGSPSIAGRHVFSTGSQMSTKDWKMEVTLVHHQFQFNVKMVKHKCPPRP